MAYTDFDGIGGWIKGKIVSPARQKAPDEEQKEAGIAPEPAFGD